MYIALPTEERVGSRGATYNSPDGLAEPAKVSAKSGFIEPKNGECYIGSPGPLAEKAVFVGRRCPES